LDATANVPGTFVYTPVSGTVLSPGTHTLSVTFTPTDPIDYTTATATVILNVPMAPSTGIITTIAGNGSYAYSGDGGQAIDAAMMFPATLTVDSAGNLYIPDNANNVVRKVTATTGIITTIAGTGTQGDSGDGGLATSAELYSPFGVAVDASGNVYIADSYNNQIREITASTGIISTVVGTGTAGDSGDNGPATQAEINSPEGLAFDSSGNLYFADTQNGVVREVDVSTGIITRVAGNGFAGYAGDGGPPTSAQLWGPSSIVFDASGDMYIADAYNQAIREVSHSTGNISTIAGNGTAGYAGDGGPATSAELNYPYTLAVDATGNIYVSDYGNFVVRKVSTAGVITTVAGNGTGGYSGDGGPATSAELSYPHGVALDAAGNLYVADTGNHVVRVVGSGQTATPTFSPAGGTYSSAQSVTISDATSGATIYYTTDGSTPTAASNVFSGPITVSSSETIKAIGTASGYAQSAAGSASYIINMSSGQAAVPTFSPGSGTYTSTQTVTIGDATSGAAIYYTTNGMAPTTSSTQYSGPITVSSSETVEAIATATGYSLSAVGSATYSIGVPQVPTFVQSQATNGGASTLAFASNVTAGDALYVIYYWGASRTFADSQSNTWTTSKTGALVDDGDTIGVGCAIAGSSGPDTVTFLANGAPASVLGVIYEVKNATCAQDVAAVTTDTLAQASCNSGALTTATANDLLVGMCGLATPQPSFSAGSGWSDGTTFSSNNGIDGVAELQVATLPGSYTMTSGTYSPAGEQGAIEIAFLPTYGAPPAATPTFSPAGGIYSSAQTVTISDATSGAAIYYTTDSSTPTTSSTQYASPITVSSSETVEAIATATGYSQSAVGSAAYTIAPTAATPSFSPNAGTYTSTQTVTISDATSGATIYYTIDGSTPSTSSTQYTGPITVSSSETVEAIATASGYSHSAVGTAVYTITSNGATQTPTPTFTPGGGTYSSTQTVTISDATSGVTIYYTTDGSTPTTSSTQYTGPITVSSSETIEAIATDTGYAQSAVGSAAYTITPGGTQTTSVSYAYDSLGRLNQAQYTTPSGTITVTYSYDSDGNRTSVVTQ
jgi:hypothetical protein